MSSASRIEQSASLPGSVEDSSSPLRRVSSRALRAAARALAAWADFADDQPRGLGVLLEVLGKPLGHDLLYEAAHLGVAELGLGLALELRIAQLDRDDRREPFSDVLTGEVVVLLLEDALPASVVVDRAWSVRS